MRIIKTSAQAKAEEEAGAQAVEQTKVCPECGETKSWWDINETGGLSQVCLDRTFLLKKTRHYYKCVCHTCGCEWETDEWKEC